MEITPLHYLLFGAMAAVPALFWIIIFMMGREIKLRTVALTFGLGVFSVVPLLAYQSLFQSTSWWVYQWGEDLFLSPWQTAALNFLMLFGIMAVLIFAVVVILSLLLAVFSRGVLKNAQGALFQETGNFILLGVFTLIVVLVTSVFGISLNAVLATTLFLAALEEYAKHMIVRSTDDDQFRSINEAIIFSCIAGLAFSFAENIMYYKNNWGSSDFRTILLVRSVVLVFAHAMFSGIFGYFYGAGHFSRSIMVSRLVRNPHWFFRRKFFKILGLKDASVFRTRMMILGLALATGVHTVFNLFAQQGNIMIMALIAILGGAWLYYVLQSESNQKKYGLVGTEWVPNEVEFSTALDKVREAKERAAEHFTTPER